MRVVVVRHGIAVDRDDPDCPPDPDRYLTDEGRQRTRRAMRGLKRLDVRPEVVCVSPWRRAVETAEICVDVLGLDPESVERREDLLPGADPRSLADHVRGLGAECVLVIGHAPHVDRLLAELLGLGDVFMSSLKKSAAASIVLEGDRSGPTLEWLMPPRALRRLARS